MLKYSRLARAVVLLFIVIFAVRIPTSFADSSDSENQFQYSKKVTRARAFIAAPPQPVSVINSSDATCIVPPSGPWPSCATFGALTITNRMDSVTNCVIPPSGPWPPCAKSGGYQPSANSTASQAWRSACVIPPSGPWPACAKAGGATNSWQSDSAQNLPAAPAPPVVDSIYNSRDFARFGISGRPGDALKAHAAGLPFSIYMDWWYSAEPQVPDHVQYWQMIHIQKDGIIPKISDIEHVIEQNPGSVWLIGNEPDVKGQDNVSAETYATLYYEVYTNIKQLDPTAIISPGGIAQATPLRLLYLDRVLASYQQQFGQRLPADMWNIHAYVLREERDSWGVDIPAGMDDVMAGELYEIDDHDDLTIFTDNIIRFREWMIQNGYRNKPLAVTEFSILLPYDYGFPPDAIARYMRDTFDILLALSDTKIGMTADHNRLVQHWIWFQVEDHRSSYPWPDLYDSDTNSLTLIGKTYRDYLFRPR